MDGCDGWMDGWMDRRPFDLRKKTPLVVLGKLIEEFSVNRKSGPPRDRQ